MTPAAHELRFEKGLTLGHLIAALQEFVEQHPNPSEEGRPISVTVEGDLLRSITVWDFVPVVPVEVKYGFDAMLGLNRIPGTPENLNARVFRSGSAHGRLHVDGCPLQRPELYDPDEMVECRCLEIEAEARES